MALPVLVSWTAMGEGMRQAFLPLAALIALQELLMAIFYVARVLQRGFVFLFFTGGTDEFRRFDALRDLFWSILPEAASFSALQSFYFVHPSLVGDMWVETMRKPYFGKGKAAWVGQALYFVASRFAAFSLGCLAFCVKII